MPKSYVPLTDELALVAPFTASSQAVGSERDIVDIHRVEDNYHTVQATDSYVAAILRTPEPLFEAKAYNVHTSQPVTSKPLPDLRTIAEHTTKDKNARTITVNPHFLELVAKTAKKLTKANGLQTIDITITDNFSPAVFRAHGKLGDITMLIMPIRGA